MARVVSFKDYKISVTPLFDQDITLGSEGVILEESVGCTVPKVKICGTYTSDNFNVDVETVTVNLSTSRDKQLEFKGYIYDYSFYRNQFEIYIYACRKEQISELKKDSFQSTSEFLSANGFTFDGSNIQMPVNQMSETSINTLRRIYPFLGRGFCVLGLNNEVLFKNDESAEEDLILGKRVEIDPNAKTMKFQKLELPEEIQEGETKYFKFIKKGNYAYYYSKTLNTPYENLKYNLKYINPPNLVIPLKVMYEVQAEVGQSIILKNNLVSPQRFYILSKMVHYGTEVTTYLRLGYYGS